VSKLKIKINNVAYSGFEEVDIYKSMLMGAGAFSVSVSNFYKGGNSLSDIKIEDDAIVEIEDQKVLTGIVDKMPIKWGKTYSWMDLVGRDKTCDLVDCSFAFTPNEWKNQSVETIIKNLCNPFSISVITDSIVSAQVSVKIDTYKACEGESVFDSISELCRDYAMMPVIYGDGKLTLTKATATRRTTDGIIVGKNVDACATEQGNENRYSDYMVKGQGIGSDNKVLDAYISCYGTFSDSIINRTRPLTLFMDLPTTTGGCQKRAKWEARIRAGLSRAIEYQVPKWVQTNNKIWEINSLTTVQDKILGIDKTMLILSIRYMYSKDTGEISKITVVDKDTFNLSDNDINIKSGFDR
jgi:prophage tail gpP-like protein